jgi:transaldolase
MPAPELASKLFVDGGDAAESRRVRDLLGRLDGQTTNPTLVASNPEIRSRLERGSKLSRREALAFYRDLVREIATLTSGPISIEVYADAATTREEMLAQAAEMWTWIPNGVIKFPITAAGLAAAQQAVRDGMRVNMTLCFTQSQAAAVYAATRGARQTAFVSPFVGRLDDRGENGMQLVENLLAMYRPGDGHVEVLTASVRHLDHLLYAIRLGSPLITSPAKVLEEWAARGFPLPGADYLYPARGLKPLPYAEVPLDRSWEAYELRHDLTDLGLLKFADHWNTLLIDPLEEIRAPRGHG